MLVKPARSSNCGGRRKGSTLPKVLIVEDDASYADTLESDLCRTGNDVEIFRAVSAADAKALLERENFDLALCDLRLPRNGGEEGPTDQHGEWLFGEARKVAPGLPIVLLSAYVSLDLYELILHKHGVRADVFGEGKDRPLVHCFSKEKLGEALSVCRDILSQVRALRSIEVSGAKGPVELDPTHKRVLRIFGRRYGGTVVRVEPLGGGLSTSTNLHVRVKNENGVEKAIAFAKLDKVRILKREIEGFENHISPLSTVSTFAPRCSVVDLGAYDAGGLFYTIAEDHDRSLFDVLVASPNDAVEIVQKLQAAEEKWFKASVVENRTVKAIRREFASNKVLAENAEILADVPSDEVEKLTLQVKVGPQHGDLHGLNVLVNRKNEPLLIDYGDVGESTSCRDALALEFGLLFHPKGAALRGDWPTADQAAVWRDLDAFLQGCPYPEFIRSCREWAYGVAEGEAQVLATAYGLCIQAFRFDTTDHAVAAAAAKALANQLLLT